jgi:hypothetical protein
LPDRQDKHIPPLRPVKPPHPRPGEHVYTVAAQTDRRGLVHLAVDVRRGNDGALRLGGYPALVGPPPSAPVTADPDAGLRDVDNAELQATVARALRNYLAGDADQLAADLAPSARVTMPRVTVRMTGLDAVKSSTGGSVIATVTAAGKGGESWTLRYEVDVSRAAGRWEVGAIAVQSE